MDTDVCLFTLVCVTCRERMGAGREPAARRSCSLTKMRRGERSARVVVGIVAWSPQNAARADERGTFAIREGKPTLPSTSACYLHHVLVDAFEGARVNQCMLMFFRYDLCDFFRLRRSQGVHLRGVSLPFAWRGVPSSRGYFCTLPGGGTIIWGVLLYEELW